MTAKVIAPPRSDGRTLARLVLLLSLFAGELLLVSFRYDALGLVETGGEHIWFGWLGYSGHLAKIGIVFAVAFLLALGPRLQTLYSNLLEEATAHAYVRMLLAQLIAYAAFFWFTHTIFANPSSSLSLPVWPVVMWLAALPLMTCLWLLAVAPAAYWLDLVRAERFAIGVASLVAIAAWGIAQASQELWGPLSDMTFDVSASLLGLAYSDVILDTESHLLGTRQFAVNIAAACSGYEGIGLVVVFTSFYLSVFRRDFRFPHALLLFPLGIITIWTFNAVRIVLLIIIGHELSPEVALGGFHSQAGWISFVLVTVGLMVIAYKVNYFSASRNTTVDRTGISAPVALLVPLVVLLSSTMLTSALFCGS